MKPRDLCRFAKLFARATGQGCGDPERADGWKKLGAWLVERNKNRNDIGQLLAEHQSQSDHASNCPLRSSTSPPPPSDPRDGAPHSFDDPVFTPVSLVDGIVSKYATMAEHARTILRCGSALRTFILGSQSHHGWRWLVKSRIAAKQLRRMWLGI
jgi:hypothetical protein